MEMTEVNAAWGRRIRRLRREREITVTDMARRIEITRRSLHRIEGGEQGVADPVRVRIAAELGVEVSAIFNYDLEDAS